MTAQQLTRHLWVVEMLSELTDEWEPTVGSRLTRDRAREALKQWRHCNPNDRFRVALYVRAPQEPKP